MEFGERVLPEKVTDFLSHSNTVKKILSTGAYGATGYVVGAAGGFVTGAVIGEGSPVVIALSGLVGNRLGVGVALIAYKLKTKKDEREQKELTAKYEEALADFKEKYAPLTVYE